MKACGARLMGLGRAELEAIAFCETDSEECEVETARLLLATLDAETAAQSTDTEEGR